MCYRRESRATFRQPWPIEVRAGPSSSSVIGCKKDIGIELERYSFGDDVDGGKIGWRDFGVGVSKHSGFKCPAHYAMRFP